jgi:hypothetical protein
VREVGANLPATREELRGALAASADQAPAQRPKSKPSARAQSLWDRLGDWYGVRFADQFGDVPPPDWCALIDKSASTELVQVMVLLRQRHVTFPPTLPEFAALVKEVRKPVERKSVTAALTEFIVRHRRLAPEQMLGMYWTFRYREAPDGSQVVTALEVAAVGGNSGYRVTVEDMLAESEEL